MMERVKIGCCGFPRGMKHYFSQFKSENIDNMKKFFQSLTRDDFLFAWEPRQHWRSMAGR